MNNELKEEFPGNKDVRVHGTMATRTASNWLIPALMHLDLDSKKRRSVLSFSCVSFYAAKPVVIQRASMQASSRFIRLYFETSCAHHERKHPWNFYGNIGKHRYELTAIRVSINRRQWIIENAIYILIWSYERRRISSYSKLFFLYNYWFRKMDWILKISND